MGKRGPAPLVDEQMFIPRNNAEAVALEKALVDNGCQRAMAGTIIMGLIRLGELGDDGFVSAQRAVYRRELRKLGQPPWGGTRRSEYMGAFISSLGDMRSRRLRRHRRLGDVEAAA